MYAVVRRLLETAEEFVEREHPRRSDGEFAPKNVHDDAPSSSPVPDKPPARVTRAGALVAAPDKRADWPDHIKRLKLPPAWTNLKISSDPNADLLAIGKDAKGRDQYVYHERFSASQSAVKFARIAELDQKFEAIKAQVAKDRRSRDADVRDVADCTHLVMTMGLRPGGDDDTKAEKRAYGASTLEGRHVVVGGGKTRLVFVGKKGVDVDLVVEDPELVAMLKRRRKEAGPDGPLFPNTNAQGLLNYVGKLDGGSFKTKDLRTLHGTRVARDAVAGLDAPTSEKEYRKHVLSVAKRVSTALGNTPSVALTSYISPVVFAPWASVAPASDGKEEAAVRSKSLPGVRFGSKGLPDWRKSRDAHEPDDDEQRKPAKSVVTMLGFDPSKQRPKKEHGALGKLRSHADVHDELVRVLHDVRAALWKMLGTKPEAYLRSRDALVNVGDACRDAAYRDIVVRCTTEKCPRRGVLAEASRVPGMMRITMYDVLGSVYERWLPEFYNAPSFTEAFAHEMTHQLQNVHDADFLVAGRKETPVGYDSTQYVDSPRELQAYVTSAVVRFSQHAKVRGVEEFWAWARKQPLIGGWMASASPASLKLARTIVSQILEG